MKRARMTAFAVLVLQAVGGLPTVMAESYPPNAGKPHPQIVLPTIEHDRALVLSQYRGRKVVIVHFASWSQPCRRDLPAWHQKTKHLVAAGELVVLGVAHEQHADRCRLFAQWQQIDWPILHDPLNLVGVDDVPLLVGVDEYGIVRQVTRKFDAFVDAFVAQKFAEPEKPVASGPEELPDPRITRRYAGESRQASGWRDHGDALVLSGLPPQIGEAIKVYGQAIKMDAQNAEAFFRLGVAHRVRWDSPQRQDGDFQAAVDAWREASRLAPGCEVFRRRIQQYGPVVDRPFAFYDWIEQARREITGRGQTPVELAGEPLAVEMAEPRHGFTTDNEKGPKGDPTDKVKRDRKNLVEARQVHVRGTDKENRGIVAVHLMFRPNRQLDAQWSDQTGPLRLWLDRPKTGKLSRRFVEYANRGPAPSAEERTLTFEVKLPSRPHGTLTVDGYVLYGVCQGKDGRPELLRQDVKVKIKW